MSGTDIAPPAMQANSECAGGQIGSPAPVITSSHQVVVWNLTMPALRCRAQMMKVTSSSPSPRE